MKTFHELQEGVYDPNIFKAIFLAGGPGSGKSYVVRRTTGGLGMKIVNSDDIYEKMLNDAGLDTTPEDIFSDQGQEIRGQAKGVTKRMQGNFLDGRLGLIIDGTGKDYEKISKQVSGFRLRFSAHFDPLGSISAKNDSNSFLQSHDPSSF